MQHAREIEVIKRIMTEIKNSKHCVLFTGAGISTASGLPDYRGPEGIWTLRDKGLPIPRTKKPWATFEPNRGHIAIAKLISSNYVKFLISQNVDGLHLKSGVPTSKIAELHGNSSIMRCVYCKSKYHIDELGWKRSIHGRGRSDEEPHPNAPVCFNCGGRILTTVVDFGDALPNEEIQRAKAESILADLFIVLGSSLSVSPAASFPKIAKKHGAKVIIVNIGETKNDKIANEKYDIDVSVLMEKISNMLLL